MLRCCIYIVREWW